MPDPVPQEQGVDPGKRIERLVRTVARLQDERASAERAADVLATECDRLRSALRDAGLLSPSLSREDWRDVIEAALDFDGRVPPDTELAETLRRWLATGETD